MDVLFVFLVFVATEASCYAWLNTLPSFTLGIVTTDARIDVEDFLKSEETETTPWTYRQVMIRTWTSDYTQTRPPLAGYYVNKIRLYVNPVRMDGIGLDKFVKKLFCSPQSRGMNAVFFHINTNATSPTNGIILANIMTTLSNFAGIPTMSWSGTPIFEVEQTKKVDFPTLLLAPSVRSQARAIYDFLKGQVPAMMAGILASQEATGYELFTNEMNVLASRDTEGSSSVRFRPTDRFYHLSTRFVDHTNSSIRENLMFLRDHTGVKAIVLYAEPFVADLILKEAHLLGMTTAEFLWICGRQAFVEPPMTPKNYPPGLLAVTFNTSLDVQKLALKAAVRIWTKAVRRLLLAVKNSADIVPSISCTRFTTPKWKYGQLFHKFLKRRMNKLLVGGDDAYGYSKMLEIEIVGFDVARQWQKIGSWTLQGSLVVENKNWINRFYDEGKERSSHTGDVLKIVTLDEPPYVVYTLPLPDGACQSIAVPCRVASDSEISVHGHQRLLEEHQIARYMGRMNKTHICCQGFVIDLVKRLSKDIGFDYELFEVGDKKWGAYDKSRNQWNGLIEALLDGSADVVGTSLKINTERAGAIDFTVPFYQTGITILVKVRSGIVSSVAFLEPFSLATWLVVFVGCVNACAMFIFIFENLNHNVESKHRRKRNSCINHKGNNWRSLFESFWLVLSMLLNATLKSQTPRSISARFIVNIWAFFCVIFMSSFMANLAAFMITKEEYPDFSGIDDYRLKNPYTKNPPWTFGTIPFGATEHIIRTNFPEMHKYMGPFMVRNVDEGVEEIIEGNLDAFVYDASVLSFKAGRDKQCRLKTVGKWYAPTGYGLGLAKSSPWIHEFNRCLLRYRAEGFLQHLEDFWLSSACKKYRKESQKSTELSIVHLSSLFVALLAAVCFCLFVLIGDYCSFKRRAGKNEESNRKNEQNEQNKLIDNKKPPETCKNT